MYIETPDRSPAGKPEPEIEKTLELVAASNELLIPVIVAVGAKKLKVEATSDWASSDVRRNTRSSAAEASETPVSETLHVICEADVVCTRQ